MTEAEIAHFIRSLIKFKHSIAYLYQWISTAAFYGGWVYLYTLLLRYGGGLSRHAWMIWIPTPIIFSVISIYTCRVMVGDIPGDPILSETGPLRGKVFGACFAVSYLTTALIIWRYSLPGEFFSVAWIPALIASWILIGVLAEGKEVREGYLPFRISLRAALGTLIILLVLAVSLFPAEVIWDVEFLMEVTYLSMIFSMIIVSFKYALSIREVSRLVEGEEPR